MGVHTAWGMVCGGGWGEGRAVYGGGGGGVPFFFFFSFLFSSKLRLHSADSILQRKTEMMRLLKIKSEKGGGEGESRTGVKCEGGDGKSQFALSRQSGPPCSRTNDATDSTQRVISYGSYTAVFL